MTLTYDFGVDCKVEEQNTSSEFFETTINRKVAFLFSKCWSDLRFPNDHKSTLKFKASFQGPFQNCLGYKICPNLWF